MGGGGGSKRLLIKSPDILTSLVLSLRKQTIINSTKKFVNMFLICLNFHISLCSLIIPPDILKHIYNSATKFHVFWAVEWDLKMRFFSHPNPMCFCKEKMVLRLLVNSSRYNFFLQKACVHLRPISPCQIIRLCSHGYRKVQNPTV